MILPRHLHIQTEWLFRMRVTLSSMYLKDIGLVLIQLFVLGLYPLSEASENIEGLPALFDICSQLLRLAEQVRDILLLFKAFQKL